MRILFFGAGGAGEVATTGWGAGTVVGAIIGVGAGAGACGG